MPDLHEIRLDEVLLCPNERPRLPGGYDWETARMPAAQPLDSTCLPFDVSDIASTLTVADGVAYFLEAPAVRSVPDGWELIFGERRLWAAALLGAYYVRALVLDVSAAEAAVLHYRENACRVDLPPLADAAELARLRDTLGASPAEVAAKTGRSEAHVRRRLLLLSAIEPVREAVAAARCTLEAAEHFARRPEAEQARAWPRAEEHASTTSEGVVRLDGFVRRLFQSLPLARAPWPLDLAIVAETWGRACEGCPKRTSTQVAIPGLDDGADECLDAKCYSQKAETWADIVIDRAREKGIAVLEGAEARRACPLSPGDVTDYVDLDAESPVRDPATSKPLTWRMVLPPAVTGAPDAVADIGEAAKELVKVDRAVEGARERIGEAKAQALLVAANEAAVSAATTALDDWAKAHAASRPEVRAAPPKAPEPPKPKAPGKASDRSKREAKDRTERDFAICAAVSERAANDGIPPDMLASWVVRIVSPDALAMVAERWKLDGAPRSALLAEIDGIADAFVNVEERLDGLAVELLAAELLQREGDDRDLPGQWAGSGRKKPGKGKAKRDIKPAKMSQEEHDDLAERAIAFLGTGGARFGAIADALIEDGGDTAPLRGVLNDLVRTGALMHSAHSDAYDLPPEDAPEPAPPPDLCPIDAAAVARLAKVVGVRGYHEGACSPENVWRAARLVLAFAEGKHPLAATRDELIEACTSSGSDCVDIACALLVGERKLHRTGSGAKASFTLKQLPLAAGAAKASPEDELDAKLLELCATKRTAQALRVALKGTTGEQRAASIERLVAAGRLREVKTGTFEAT